MQNRALSLSPLSPRFDSGLRAWCLLLALLCCGTGHAGTLVRLADIAVVADSNLLSAANDRPRRDGQAMQAGLSLAWSEAVSPGVSARLLTHLGGRLQAGESGLHEVAAGADGQILLRPGRSFHTPTLGVSLGFDLRRLPSQLRDAEELHGRVFLRQALTTRLHARAALSVRERDARSAVFDDQTWATESALDWLASERLTLTIGYEYRDGDVTSIGRPGVAVLSNARAQVADDVFDGLTAFRFKAQTHIGLLAGHWALSPQLALDTRLRYVESDPQFNSRYRRWLLQSGLLIRF